MTPWGQEQFNAAKPSQGPRGVKLSETNDRVYKCFPPGMPSPICTFSRANRADPERSHEIFEYDHNVRHIYIDGRNIPLPMN